MKTTRRTLLAPVAMLIAAILGTPPAHATLLASESFGYPVGPLSGQSGGSGWNGAWVTGQPNVFVVQAASLTSGAGQTGGALFCDGSKASSGTGARILRAVDLGPGSAAWNAGVVESTSTKFNGRQLAFGKPGTTVWLGAVFNGGTAGNGIGGAQYLDQIHLYDGATTTPSALGLGDNNKDGECLAIGRGAANYVWNYERTCAHDNCPNLSMSSSNYLSTVTMGSGTVWLVMRFDFISPSTTQITTWLDPASGVQAPSNASALVMGGSQVVSVTGVHFNWLEMGGQTAQFSFDEVRLATTFGELSSNATLAVPRPVASASSKLLAAPNPFAGTSAIAFAMPTSGPASLAVLDVTGREVRDLTSTWLPAGSYSIPWDGRDDGGTRLHPGVYLVRLRNPSETRTVRVQLLQ